MEMIGISKYLPVVLCGELNLFKIKFPILFSEAVALLSTWISNHMPRKVWVKLLNHSQISTITPLKFGNW